MKTMDTEKTTGIRVPLQQAEKAQKYLAQNNLLRTDLKSKKTNSHIFFPVKKESEHIITPYTTVIDTTFEKQRIKPTTYKEILTIPDKLKQDLPTSYDSIGDIILIKLTKNLLKYKKKIGQSLLISNTHIKVVCAVQPVSGELRTRQLDIIAGEHRTQTTHTEYGLHFDLDVKKTYFSPRLATERRYVTTQVQPGETIVDMFAGVAPFSIMIAKNAQPKNIYAVDKNKDAIAYARRNIKKNNVLDKIEVIQADAKTLPRYFQKQNIYADRIIMNLPFSAHLFFPYALQIAADPCMIHYYDIVNEEQIQEKLNSLQQMAQEHKMEITRSKVRRIKTYAPREFYIGIDITAKKQMPL